MKIGKMDFVDIPGLNKWVSANPEVTVINVESILIPGSGGPIYRVWVGYR